MKGKRDNTDYINEILNSITEVEEFTKNMNFEAFFKDMKTRHAVVRCLEILGEATKNISQDVKDKNPKIPWKKMAGMRDILAHEYFGIDIKKVWEVKEKELSSLKALMKNLSK
jgi:uncharacterized protein with HEPN domain